MKVFSYKKRYAILPSNDPLVLSKQYAPSDLKKFLVDTDIYQGQILKATIPAGGEIITRNRNHTIHVEKFDEQSEVYIAIDEYLWSIEFPQGASVYTEKVQEAGGGSDGEITLQDKTITENGTYKADEGFDGLGNVVVDVASSGDGEDFLAARLNNTLKEYSSGEVTIIPERAFHSCSTLEKINCPATTRVYDSAFYKCTSLKDISFPACTSVGKSAFFSCVTTENANLPACTYLSNAAFGGCSKLVSINIPNCTGIGSNVFEGCSLLPMIALGACSYIANYAFKNCTALSRLYLSASSVCVLEAQYAFMSTPIHSGIGSIFVPASLVDAYKVASNWSYFANQIFAYEE